MKKALFIMGGPRKKGNLASMLNITMKKAEDAGYELHYVNLYEKKISPCIGCMKCKQTCICAIKDDNNSSIPKSRLSSNHEYILMTTCNTPWPFDRIAGQSTGCIKAMKEFLNVSGMKFRGKVVLAGTRNINKLPKSIENKIARLIK